MAGHASCPWPDLRRHRPNPFAYVDDNPLIGTDPSGHGLFDFVGNAVSAGAQWVNNNVIQPAWNGIKAVAGVISNGASAAIDWAEEHYRAAAHYVNEHVVQPVVRVVKDVYHKTVTVVKKTVRAVVQTVHTVAKAAVHVATTAAHAVAQTATTVAHAVATGATKAVSATVDFAKNHAAAIVSTVVGVAVFAGCTFLTMGAGVIGCAALAGAAASGVSYAMSCQASQGGCTPLGAVEAH